MLLLHPVAERIAQISRQDERTAADDAELASLTERLVSNPAALRLVELTKAHPMSCANFEIAANGDWSRFAVLSPEFAQGLEVIRQQCAAGASVVEGLWDGLVHPDWHSRVVLGDEELPRSEDTVKTIATVGGVALMVAGGIVAAIPCGACQAVGGVMIAGGVAAFGYGVNDNFIGAGCELDADGQPSQCGPRSIEQMMVASNGCVSGLAACTESASCGSNTFCTYGCCEAYSSGLAKQEAGISTYAISIAIPAGVSPNSVGVWGSRAVKINDRARVMRDDGSGAPVITSTAGSNAEIGADAFVGNLFSEGNATLRDRAYVNGTLTVDGDVYYGNASTVTISGTQTRGDTARSAQRPQTRLIWLTGFKDTALPEVSVEPDQTRPLSPGDYGSVTVKARSHLVLEPGQYHFNGLTLTSDSFLDIPANQLTRIDVRSTLNLQGKVVQAGSAQTLLVTYVGSNAYVTQKFSGSLIAPYAFVNLDVAGAELRASIWGMSVELHQGGRIRLANTSVWDLVSTDWAAATGQ